MGKPSRTICRLLFFTAFITSFLEAAVTSEKDKTLIIYSGPTSSQCNRKYQKERKDRSGTTRVVEANYHRNFQFFLNHGMPHSYEDHKNFHVALVLTKETAEMYDEDLKRIKAIHPHTSILLREDRCFYAESLRIALKRYEGRYNYYILLTAELVGPFQPFHELAHYWAYYFLSHLTESTKLVGLSFSCEVHPHVQSMLWATDELGLSAIVNAGCVYNCVHENQNFTAYQDFFKRFELGISDAILEEGYELAVVNAAQKFRLSLVNDEYYANNHKYCGKNMWFTGRGGATFDDKNVPLGNLFWKSTATAYPHQIEHTIYYQDSFHMKTRPERHMFFDQCQRLPDLPGY